MWARACGLTHILLCVRCRYVRRLQKRYTPNPQLDPDPPAPDSDADPSRSVPVAFVSLLRKGLPDRDRSEAKLASAFDFVSGCCLRGPPIGYP